MSQKYTGKNSIAQSGGAKKKPGKKKTKKSLLGTIVTLIILALYVWLDLGSTEDTPAAVGNREKAEFVRVVDGDTIIVNYNGEKTRVRLIGINSPESVHEDGSKNTQEGRDASAFLKEYLADTSYVWLEFDVEAKDQYERALAYVWMSAEGTDISEDMLNGIIVKKGYAEARSYKPNVKYQNELEELE